MRRPDVVCIESQGQASKIRTTMFTQHLIRSSDGVGFTVLPQLGDRLKTTPLIIKAIFLAAAIIGTNLLINIACPVTEFPHDDFILLDGIWRTVQGQHAGTDYHDPVGFWLSHIGATWWRVVGPDRSVIALTSATFSIIIMLCMSFALANRLSLSPKYCLLVCAVVAFEASAPSVYGWSVFMTGMAGYYNRVTVAALAVLFLQSFIKPRGSPPSHIVWDAAITAVLLDVLFLVKISAFILGIGVIMIGEVAFRLRPLRNTVKFLMMICLLLAIMLAADLALSGTNPEDFFDTYQAAAETKFLSLYGNSIDRVLKSWSLVVSVLLFATYARRTPAIPRRTSMIVIGTYAAIQLCLNVSNTQPETIFMAPACAIALLSWRPPSPPERPDQAPRRRWLSDSPMAVLPAVICLLVLIPQMVSSAFGLALVASVVSGREVPIYISAGKGITVPVVGAPGDAGRAEEFAINVNRGVEALEHLNVTGEAVATLDYANPFPPLFGLPSPKGVPVVWALGYDQPYDGALQPHELVGDSCIVMLPSQPTQVVKGSAELVIAAAKPILARSFNLVRDDDYWKIYRRKDGCPVTETSAGSN
jgi:predicted tellurium resistance membrane protein TerC